MFTSKKTLFSVFCLLSILSTSNYANAEWRSIKLESIHCEDQEDDTGPDEPYIKLGGKKIPVKSMSAGDVRGLQHVAPIKFNNSIEIQVWDDDWPDGDDKLGSWTVRDNETLDEVHDANFSEDDAHYIVKYKIMNQ